MKYVITAYLLRYGLATTLTDIAEGIVHAAEDRSIGQEDKRKYIEVATSVYNIRNKINVFTRTT